MVAVQITHPVPPADRVVQAQLHARQAQPRTQAAAQAPAAEGIEQAAHRHTAGGGTAQAVDQLLGADAGLDQIQLKLDLAAGRIDGREQAGKELLAIDQ
ncbi:hypothetical protein D3C75_905930 [compost metagenome]